MNKASNYGKKLLPIASPPSPSPRISNGQTAWGAHKVMGVKGALQEGQPSGPTERPSSLGGAGLLFCSKGEMERPEVCSLPRMEEIGCSRVEILSLSCLGKPVLALSLQTSVPSQENLQWERW